MADQDLWEVYTWAAGSLPYNLSKGTNRDYYIRQRIARHNHDGHNSLELDDASDTVGTRGTTRYFWDLRTVLSGTQQSVWLTQDGTSTGTPIFSTVVGEEPRSMTYRVMSGGPGSDPKSYRWTPLGIGHTGTPVSTFPSGNSLDVDYVTELKKQAGISYVWVKNYGTYTARGLLFLTVVMGKSYADYAGGGSPIGEDTSKTGTWKSYETIDWEADQEVCTEEKMDRLYTRDDYLRRRIGVPTGTMTHTHNGWDYPAEENAFVIHPRTDRRGASPHWTEVKQIAASSSATFYISRNRMFDGSDPFTSRLGPAAPLVMVYRGVYVSSTNNTWDVRRIGHDFAGTYCYNFEFWYDAPSSQWRCEVFNYDTSSHYFCVTAKG